MAMIGEVVKLDYDNMWADVFFYKNPNEIFHRKVRGLSAWKPGTISIKGIEYSFDDFLDRPKKNRTAKKIHHHLHWEWTEDKPWGIHVETENKDVYECNLCWNKVSSSDTTCPVCKAKFTETVRR